MSRIAFAEIESRVRIECPVCLARRAPRARAARGQRACPFCRGRGSTSVGHVQRFIQTALERSKKTTPVSRRKQA